MSYTVWFTGLPCSGKTTLASRLDVVMTMAGCRTFLLDGDIVRRGLCSDLGFSPEERTENLRRIAHVARMFNDAGVTILASFISPTEEVRKMIAEIIPEVRFVHVKCSPEECARRDVKGMWAKAKAGEIENFTGYSAPFEEPLDCDLVVDTEKDEPRDSVRWLCVALGIDFVL